VNLLGGVAHLALPDPYATAFVALGLVYGIPVFGFTLLWIALAAAVTIHTARRAAVLADLVVFTFPVGTVVTGTSGLALHSGSTVLAVIFYAGQRPGAPVPAVRPGRLLTGLRWGARRSGCRRPSRWPGRGPRPRRW
jgi:hypothetical protein